MSVDRDDLIEAFWRHAPERVAQATELWLAVEGGAADRLQPLRRLLHTIKGEAQMLGIQESATILEQAERLVDRVLKSAVSPLIVGDALLGAFEALGLRAQSLDADEPMELEQVLRDLNDAHERVTEAESATGRPEGATGEVVLPELRQAPTLGGPSPAVVAPGAEPGEPTASPVRPTLDVEAVQPLFYDLRRLHSELALLQPELREVHRRLRALLLEVQPNVSGDLLRERIVKTLSYGAELERRLSQLRASWSANEFATNLALEQLQEAIQQASLVSSEELKSQIHRAARSTAKSLGKELIVEVRGDALLDAAIERRLKPCLLHLVRNAVDHGIEAPDKRTRAGKLSKGKVVVQLAQSESSVRVTVKDDGGGIDFDGLRKALAQREPAAVAFTDADVLKAIFEHGVTIKKEATEISGRGVGLDVVARELAAVGGHVEVESTQGVGTRFVLTMPATLRADVVVPVVARNLHCAIPSRSVVQVVRAAAIESTSEGPRLRVDGAQHTGLVPIFALSGVIHGSGHPAPGDVAVVLQHRTRFFAITVDGFQNPRPVTFHRTEELAFRSPLVRGVAPLADGNVLLLLDVDGLFNASILGRIRLRAPAKPARRQAHVLVVEDAPVARELLSGVLRSFGLRVSEAVDGKQGLERALRDPPDLILTDLEMPYLGGLEMIARMREDPRVSEVPIIVLTTRADPEAQDRAKALGVRGFLSKQRFVEEQLREVIDECLWGK